MDVVVFLKIVPAAMGVAGLITYFMRPSEPQSTDELVALLQSVRRNSVLLGCGALILLSAWLIFRPKPPDHDVALPASFALRPAPAADQRALRKLSLRFPDEQAMVRTPASPA